MDAPVRLGMLFADDKTNLPNVMLPDERYGLLMVFRVFERTSYALVMNASRPVNVLDMRPTPSDFPLTTTRAD